MGLFDALSDRDNHIPPYGVATGEFLDCYGAGARAQVKCISFSLATSLPCPCFSSVLFWFPTVEDDIALTLPCLFTS